jgi:hypothetical protein
MRSGANRARKAPANGRVRTRSSSGVVVPDSACHTGGRGFESRRSRFYKCLQTGTRCCLIRCSRGLRGPDVARCPYRKIPAKCISWRACSPAARPQTGQGCGPTWQEPEWSPLGLSETQPRGTAWKRSGRGRSTRTRPPGGRRRRRRRSGRAAALVARDRERVPVRAVDAAAARVRRSVRVAAGGEDLAHHVTERDDHHAPAVEGGAGANPPSHLATARALPRSPRAQHRPALGGGAPPAPRPQARPARAPDRTRPETARLPERPPRPPGSSR